MTCPQPFIRRIALMLFAALIALTIGPLPLASAFESFPLVTNSFYDADLRQALSDIALDTGETIITAPEVSGYVTCDLNEVALPKALDIMLAGTGYYHIRRDDFWLIASADPSSPSFATSSRTRLIKLNYNKAESIKGLLSPAFVKFIRADKEHNCLSLTAPKPLADTIEAEVRSLDTAPRHIILDAMIVVMEKRDLLNLGVQWGFPTAQAGFFGNNEVRDQNTGLSMFGGGMPWGIQVGYTPDKAFTNALQMSLNMLSQNDEANIIASPQIMAQDGREATVEVITEEYFEILTQGYYSDSELEKIEAGTVLKIKPQIGAEGDVTLDIHTEVSDVVSRSGQNLPVVTRRKADSTVRVKDGGTAVVAGLLDSRTFMTKDEVPGFSKLPGAGRLFQNDNNRETSRQVAIFVTARLMRDSEHPVEKRIRPALRPVSEEEFRPKLRECLDRILAKGSMTQ